MGVKSLTSFLQQETPHALCVFDDLTRYRRMTMAIDVSIYMYRYAYARESTSQHCVQQFMRLNQRLAAAQVRPVYVFDGKPSAQKRDVIRHRARRRERVDAQSAPRRPRVTADHYARLRAALQAERIAYVQAEGDAEKACAWLCMMGFAHLVASDDYDALAYGAPLVVRNLNSSVFTEINRRALLRHAGMSERQFVEFCILSGCDFTPKGCCLGMRRALETTRATHPSPYTPALLSAVREYSITEVPLSAQMSCATFLVRGVVGAISLACTAGAVEAMRVKERSSSPGQKKCVSH